MVKQRRDYRGHKRYGHIDRDDAADSTLFCPKHDSVSKSVLQPNMAGPVFQSEHPKAKLKTQDLSAMIGKHLWRVNTCHSDMNRLIFQFWNNFIMQTT